MSNIEEYEEYKVNLTQKQSIELLKNALNKFEIRGEGLYLLKIAIKNIVAEREQDKNRLQELEEHLKKYYDGEIYTAKQLKQIEENQKKYFINKQKVKDEIERYEYMIAETIHGKIQKYTPGEILLKIDTLKELLEEK